MYAEFRVKELLHHQLAKELGSVLGYAVAGAVHQVSIAEGLQKVTYTVTFTVEHEEFENIVVSVNGDWQHTQADNRVQIGKE